MGNKIPGLDTLRAIAALVVVIYHTQYLGIGNKINILSLNVPDGHISVILFFAISGFLITYLLLIEQEKNLKIKIGYFYMRRVVRILPLYFLILILSALILSYLPNKTTLLLSLAVMPNIAESLNQGWSASPQIWSIGIEEQYYLFWPVFLIIFRKRLLLSILVFISILTFTPHVALFILEKTGQANPSIVSFLNTFHFDYKINCLAIGSLFGMLFFKGFKPGPQIQKLSMLFIPVPLFFWAISYNFGRFSDEIYTVLFSMLVLIISLNKMAIFNLRPVNYLGKISYGLYMYHWIVISLLIKIMPSEMTEFTWLNTIIFHSSAVIFTILISSLSFHTIEKQFLSYKKYFQSKNNP